MEVWIYKNEKFTLSFTSMLTITHLALHRIGVQLAHVSTPVLLHHRFDVQIPGVEVRMRNRDPGIVGDDLLVDGLYRLGICLHPADLFNAYRYVFAAGDCGLFCGVCLGCSTRGRKWGRKEQDISTILCECQLRIWWGFGDHLNIVFMESLSEGWREFQEKRRLGLLSFFAVFKRKIEKQNMKISRVVMRLIRLWPMNFNKGRNRVRFNRRVHRCQFQRVGVFGCLVSVGKVEQPNVWMGWRHTEQG